VGAGTLEASVGRQLVGAKSELWVSELELSGGRGAPEASGGPGGMGMDPASISAEKSRKIANNARNSIFNHQKVDIFFHHLSLIVVIAVITKTAVAASLFPTLHRNNTAAIHRQTAG